MVENVFEIEKYFSQHHIKLKRSWLLEALNFVSAEKAQVHLVDLIYQQWLFSDIEESTEPIDGLKKLIGGRFLGQPCVLQIQSVADIGTSNWKQSKRLADPSYEEPMDFDEPYRNQTEGRSCISLRLTDGVVEVKAFEKQRVPCLSLATCPGSKILIYANVELYNGFLFMTGGNCQLLGGQKPTECVSTVPIRQMSEQRNAAGIHPIEEVPIRQMSEQRNAAGIRPIEEVPIRQMSEQRNTTGIRPIGEVPIRQMSDNEQRDTTGIRIIGEVPSRQMSNNEQWNATGIRPIGEVPIRQMFEQRNATGDRPIGEGPNCRDTTEQQKWKSERSKRIGDDDNNENKSNGGEQQRKRPLGPTQEEDDDAELFGRRVSKFLRSLSTTRRRRQACIGIEQLMMEFDEEEERKGAGA